MFDAEAIDEACRASRRRSGTTRKNHNNLLIINHIKELNKDPSSIDQQAYSLKNVHMDDFFAVLPDNDASSRLANRSI
ncbi:MAG TPA: hypothetical protein PLB97_07900 [Accumulibacter sp.]|nr:hypothetical protein [Accumulibacter sp.]HPP46206.1 hypothetical protein [Accumulibacter sp.]